MNLLSATLIRSSLYDIRLLPSYADFAIHFTAKLTVSFVTVVIL
jgi:hypothetical protein